MRFAKVTAAELHARLKKKAEEGPRPPKIVPNPPTWRGLHRKKNRPAVVIDEKERAKHVKAAKMTLKCMAALPRPPGKKRMAELDYLADSYRQILGLLGFTFRAAWIHASWARRRVLKKAPWKELVLPSLDAPRRRGRRSHLEAPPGASSDVRYSSVLVGRGKGRIRLLSIAPVKSLEARYAPQEA